MQKLIITATMDDKGKLDVDVQGNMNLAARNLVCDMVKDDIMNKTKAPGSDIPFKVRHLP